MTIVVDSYVADLRSRRSSGVKGLKAEVNYLARCALRRSITSNVCLPTASGCQDRTIFLQSRKNLTTSAPFSYFTTIVQPLCLSSCILVSSKLVLKHDFSRPSDVWSRSVRVFFLTCTTSTLLFRSVLTLHRNSRKRASRSLVLQTLAYCNVCLARRTIATRRTPDTRGKPYANLFSSLHAMRWAPLD
jgi:hypothetical protein